ncbi:Uncharacterised protein [Mycobacteroides abscessus subsp. massiliense]|nr:Uncharacterised protein [Mycobacteroides abscessus subsp. massiliense]
MKNIVLIQIDDVELNRQIDVVGSQVAFDGGYLTALLIKFLCQRQAEIA